MKSKRVKKTPARYQNEFIEPPTKRRKGRPSKNSHGARPHSSNSAIKKWNLRPSTSAQRFNSSEFNDESDSESGLTDDEKKVLVTIEYQ
ncbi:unnamed protein product [Allacma fusca]|uniref:Uncharacterized protein n=1 Tax=Allacma fusca TaxID=39272 RepID=A0A8J2KEU9_9HEXA|nr:unnamed protein product [Allacma fusca]